MDSNHLTRPRDAGVWPEGLVEPLPSNTARSRWKWMYHNEPQHDDAARALLIDKMMDELPTQWHVYQDKSVGLWRVDDYRTEASDEYTDPDKGEPEYECDVDPLIKGEDPDKFLAIFSALVASGRVK